MNRRATWILGGLGLFLIGLSALALKLGNLRTRTVPFVVLFFSAFLVYAAACFIVLGAGRILSRGVTLGVLGAALLMQGILVFSQPTLSDDMYRYVWDGRVQAHGISPYRYPPDAPQLVFLRDHTIYPSINRPSAVTVYPPAAELAYAVLWRIWPDAIHWFQAAMAGGGLVAGLLLLGVLGDLGLSKVRAVIFLWSPLLTFETSASAHVDGLLLPLLVGAWWARLREKDLLTGFLLGIAAAVKLYPALLLPFLWRPRHPRGRWQMPLAFAISVALFYLPYILASGWGVLGYLPSYFQEKFNVSPLVSALRTILGGLHFPGPDPLAPLALILITGAAVWFLLHPTTDGAAALRWCIWPIGVVSLLSQDLFSWYMLWLLPLVAIFLAPSRISLGMLKLPRLDAWTGWWLFCGLIGLSYLFFVKWVPVKAAIQAQFDPLFAFLLINPVAFLWKKYLRPWKGTFLHQKAA